MTLTEKIIELVPEIREREMLSLRPASITLADVLRAIRSHANNWFVRDDGTFFKWEKFTEGGSGHHGVESTYITWNLSTDLEGQSDETKTFISKVLGVYK